jgi:hypothetical protein
MKPGDLIRINWEDHPHEVCLVLEISVLNGSTPYLDPDDMNLRLLDQSGNVYETAFNESEVLSGFFEVFQALCDAV